MELWRLTAHRHWLTLSLFGRELRLCARCSGYVAGFLLLTGISRSFGIPLFHSLDEWTQVMISFALLLPMAFDWVTQSWGLRDSNNRLRVLTGAALGMGVALFLTIDAPAHMRAAFYLATGLVVASAGLIGKRQCGALNCS
jgi:uncharacterized membrane protein